MAVTEQQDIFHDICACGHERWEHDNQGCQNFIQVTEASDKEGRGLFHYERCRCKHFTP